MMTPSATRFVGELTFAALTRHPIETDVGGLLPDQRIGHIVIADSADAIVVAPATAHWLAAMATGLAGDAVTATCLATAAPVVVAPAMDGEMFGHPATRAQRRPAARRLRLPIVEPDRRAARQRPVRPRPTGGDGRHRGRGRGRARRPARSGSPDPAARPPVVGRARDADLAGRHVVDQRRRDGGADRPRPVHRQPLDRQDGRRARPGGPRSGRPGDADRRARQRGAAGRRRRPVVPAETTAEMGSAVRAAMDGADALIMAAAVADFRPRPAASTEARPGRGLTLELEPTEDILAGDRGHRRGACRRIAPRPILVGFAAETGSLDAGGRQAPPQGRRPPRRE